MIVTEYQIVNDRKKHPKLYEYNKYSYNGDLHTFQGIAEMFKECLHLDKLANEYLYVLAFNNIDDFLGMYNVSHGTSGSTFVSAREIFIFALLCGATKITLCHNHPTGILKPSVQDSNMTKYIKSLGINFDIALDEHLIVSSKGFCLIDMNKKYKWEI